ncbi:hypothetical protein ACQ86O_27330 (plasmid) [Serratia sp. L9]|uniref:hypothetical protein n=1 Tax=Serratia sp. L9 TaxID=3423946 RepID=UPI003D6643D4
MSLLHNSGFYNNYYWTSEDSGNGHYIVNLFAGYTNRSGNSDNFYVVCYRGL